MLVYKINIYKMHVDIDTEVHVQYNLEGENVAETGILIVERKLYFARLCSTSMTVAVTRRPPPPPRAV